MDARRVPALAAVRWTAEPPRPAVAEGLAGRLIVRNGVAEVVGVLDRQAVYFRQLLAEARRPRRQVARGVVAARVAAIEAEAAAKRRDLEARYALRVRVAPAAIVAVTTRVAEVRLRLPRRKQEGELLAHVPPGARHADAVACAACAATTRAFILCDDALHVLCEACAPLATGRPHCDACAPRSRRA